MQDFTDYSQPFKMLMAASLEVGLYIKMVFHFPPSAIIIHNIYLLWLNSLQGFNSAYLPKSKCHCT